MRSRLMMSFLLLSSLLVLGISRDALAASLSWQGVLKVVLEDTMTGTYSGGTPDVSTFSGSVVYGDTCAAGCLVEPFPPDEINYVFAGGTGSLQGLGAMTTGVESSVAITDDEVLDQDGVDLLALFGVNASVGGMIDVWSVASETAGAVIEWEVEYLYLSSDPFSDSSYTATPPPNPDLIIFQVDEGDEVTYFALGEVTSVPEAGGSAALMAVIGTLCSLRRRRRPSSFTNRTQ